MMCIKVLRRTWGGRAPSSAIFADNMYYKAESYIGSEFAGKYLYDEGLTPIYVSDNPVLNAQHVLFEAAKGYHYGLPYHAALASVTTAPADDLGMGQRLGKVKPGFDADIVVWDSDPLSVGAAPVQVWIDGNAQYEDPVELKKPNNGPIEPDVSLSNIVEEPTDFTDAIFTGVTNVLLPDEQQVETHGKAVNVVVTKGKISCIGECVSKLQSASDNGVKTIPVKDGHLTHAFTGVAGTLGLNEIDSEKSTDNGDNPDAFTRAIDGLQLQGKKLHAGFKYGVTRAISAPKFRGDDHHGTSVGFETTAQHSLEKGAVFASDVSVHYTLNQGARRGDSFSGAFGALRKKLLDAVKSKDTPDEFTEAFYLQKVIDGNMTLALTINSADGIATALRIKSQVEEVNGKPLKVAIIGGAESHLVAKHLADASVGVILLPLQPGVNSWESRRALSGAPLTNGTTVDWLMDAGVTVGVGLPEDWWVRDLGFQAGTAFKNGNGKISEQAALDLVSTNIYSILGAKQPEGHFIVHEGNPLDIGSRIKAVGAGQRVSVFI